MQLTAVVLPFAFIAGAASSTLFTVTVPDRNQAGDRRAARDQAPLHLKHPAAVGVAVAELGGPAAGALSARHSTGDFQEAQSALLGTDVIGSELKVGHKLGSVSTDQNASDGPRRRLAMQLETGAMALWLQQCQTTLIIWHQVPQKRAVRSGNSKASRPRSCPTQDRRLSNSRTLVMNKGPGVGHPAHIAQGQTRCGNHDHLEES
jgi:hypothetical protein